MHKVSPFGIQGKIGQLVDLGGLIDFLLGVNGHRRWR